MRPRTMMVFRENSEGQRKTIRVLIEPDHPRFRASLGCGVKAAMTEESRYKLCEVLAPHFDRAMDRDSDDPLIVNIGEDAYALAADDRNPDKVKIRFYRPSN